MTVEGKEHNVWSMGCSFHRECYQKAGGKKRETELSLSLTKTANGLRAFAESVADTRIIGAQSFSTKWYQNDAVMGGRFFQREGGQEDETENRVLQRNSTTGEGGGGKVHQEEIPRIMQSRLRSEGGAPSKRKNELVETMH